MSLSPLSEDKNENGRVASPESVPVHTESDMSCECQTGWCTWTEQFEILYPVGTSHRNDTVLTPI